MAIITHRALIITGFKKTSVKAAYKKATEVFSWLWKREKYPKMISPIKGEDRYCSFSIFIAGLSETDSRYKEFEFKREVFRKYLARKRVQLEWIEVEYQKDSAKILDYNKIR